MDANKSTKKIIEDKYEDRGWGDYDQPEQKKAIPIEPLPFSFEEYKKLSLALAEQAYETNTPELYNTLFELQRRARYGNNYPDIEELAPVEEELWNKGVELSTKQITPSLETMIGEIEISVKPGQSENKFRGK